MKHGNHTQIFFGDRLIIDFYNDNARYTPYHECINLIIGLMNAQDLSTNSIETYFTRYTDGEPDGYIWIYRKYNLRQCPFDTRDFITYVDKMMESKGIGCYGTREMMGYYYRCWYYDVCVLYDDYEKWSDCNG